MHICPQEIIAVMTAIDYLKPYIGFVKIWCQQCSTGEHRNCDDHAIDACKTVEGEHNGI